MSLALASAASAAPLGSARGPGDLQTSFPTPGWSHNLDYSQVETKFLPTDSHISQGCSFSQDAPVGCKPQCMSAGEKREGSGTTSVFGSWVDEEKRREPSGIFGADLQLMASLQDVNVGRLHAFEAVLKGSKSIASSE